MPAMSRTSATFSVSVLLPLPVRSNRSIDSIRDWLPGVLAPWLAMAVRFRATPLPERAMVSTPLPPSMRASWPALTPLASAAMLAALRTKRSSPAPP